jgi:hypothetical protein
MSTCRKDGLLLKPSYPAVALDRVLHQRAQGKISATLGEINVAYTCVWRTHSSERESGPELGPLSSGPLSSEESGPELAQAGFVPHRCSLP